jgi:hypothetical protein
MEIAAIAILVIFPSGPFAVPLSMRPYRESYA